MAIVTNHSTCRPRMISMMKMMWNGIILFESSLASFQGMEIKSLQAVVVEKLLFIIFQLGKL